MVEESRSATTIVGWYHVTNQAWGPLLFAEDDP
jgi:hypothetical protein